MRMNDESLLTNAWVRIDDDFPACCLFSFLGPCYAFHILHKTIANTVFADRHLLRDLDTDRNRRPRATEKIGTKFEEKRNCAANPVRLQWCAGSQCCVQGILATKCLKLLFLRDEKERNQTGRRMLNFVDEARGWMTHWSLGLADLTFCSSAMSVDCERGSWK